MPTLESTSPGQQPAAGGSSKTSQGIEGGDASAHIDFYQLSDNSPAVVDGNDPNAGPGEEGEGLPEIESEEGDEGAAAEEAGEVGEEEEGEGEGEGAEEGGEAGEGEDDGEGEQKAAKPPKTTSVSFGGKDYDVPLDATIPVPVNGEVETPSLQDLRNAYSSKASIRKELEQVGEAKKELTEHRRAMRRGIEKKEVALVEKEVTINRGRELLAKGQIEAALNEFFEYSPDVWDRFDEMMSGYYPDFAKLQPAARRAIQLERRTKLMETKQTLATQAAGMQKEIDAFNTYKQQRCEATGLDESEVEDAWDVIAERAQKGGYYTPQQIQWLQNADARARWETALGEALAGKVRGKITDVVKKQFPKLENKLKEIISNLEENRSVKFLTKATKEDIAKIVAREYNEGKVGKPAGKVAPTNSLRDKAQPRHKLGEVAAQDDDDEDIYDQGGRDEPSNAVWGSGFTR